MRAILRLLATIAATSASCVVVACGGSADASPGADAAGLATKFDSAGDTVIATVAGDVAPGGIRRIAEQLRIAPTADDTSLFTDVFEFDVDRSDRVWVYDRPLNRVFLFGADGALLKKIGRQGAGPGEFAQNGGMVALGDSGLAVWDSRNARISLFDRDGTFRTSWRTPAGFSTSNGLYTDRSGVLYVKRPVTPERPGEILGRMGLVRLKDEGAFADSLVPLDLPVARETYLAVSPDGTGRSSTGSSFAPNYFWAWHPDGYFIVAHGGRYEIIAQRPTGKPLVIRRALPDVAILPDERSEEQERITFNMRQTQPGWRWSGPDLPTVKAPLQQLFVSRDGRIWARVATPSEKIPVDELETPREKGPPIRHYRAPSVWEVFAPDGRFLGRVPLPWRTALMEADGDNIWALVRDDSDLPAVVRFKLEPMLR